MHLFVKQHSGWRDRGSVPKNMTDDEFREYLKAEVIEINTDIAKRISEARQARSVISFHYPDDPLEEDKSNDFVFFNGPAQEYLVRTHRDWRTTRVQYRLSPEGCCSRCAGSGIDANLGFKCCSYCDGTKIQIRNAIPDNFEAKPVSDNEFQLKTYRKWRSHYEKVRSVLAECPVME